MYSLQAILDYFLCFVEGFSAVCAVFFFKSVKNQYWKYFALYLIAIFLFDSFGRFGKEIFSFSKIKYYNFLVIPFQFVFFYWLYAMKSFENKRLFWIFSLLYIVSFIPSEFYFKGNKIVFSFNYTFGCLLLMILVIMEYYRQINSSDIINFHKNRMFYINLGVTLFYIGTLPFYTFYQPLRDYEGIWGVYCFYSQISNIIMYLLFSFIWVRQSS